MDVYDWSSDVNTRVLRDSSWQVPTRFIADKTRCGVRKVRQAIRQEPQTYSIKMRFSKSERNAFVSWFNDTLSAGTAAFWFKDITKETDNTLAYRFQDGKVSFSNPSGEVVDVTMTWERVEGLVKNE